MMMWPWFNWGFGSFWWIMPILMVLFWGLVIWVTLALIRRASWAGRCCGDSSVPTDSALEILKRRYARGEISKEEFEERKRSLA
jgi:putative membrane protein